MKSLTVGLLALLILGCQKPPTLQLKSASVPKLSREDEVRIAVFRYLLDQEQRMREPFSASTGPPGFGPYPQPPPPPPAYFLAITGPKRWPREDPTDAVMGALGPQEIPAKKYSQCIPGGLMDSQFLDKDTGRPGIVLWVGPIQWTGADTAVVETGGIFAFMSAGGETLHVRWDRDHWEVGSSWVRWGS